MSVENPSQTPQNEQPEPTPEGPRRTSRIEQPGGTVVSSEITGDGMKQTRQTGGSATAASFHEANSVAQEYELPETSAKKSHLKRVMGKLLSR